MPGGIVKVSERLGAGASKSSVSAWRRGDSLPSDPMRERIFELGGPEPSAWDVALEPTSGALAALGPSAEAGAPRGVTADDTATEAELLRASIRKMHAELNGNSDLDLGQRTRIAASLTAMVDKLGHHTGVKLTERQMRDSPIFVAMWDRVVEALELWPEAMLAAADAIDELKAKS